MGSACLFFAIRPPQAVLGDINSALVDAFRAIQNHPELVHRALVTLPLGERNYYRIRRLDPLCLGWRERAARFVYLNRFCFNGLYRTNSKGEFNVPYSATGSVPSLVQIRAAGKALRCAKIANGDFIDTISTAKAGDFVYMDPPFAVSNRRIFRQYESSSFGLSDVDRLAAALQLLDERKVDFLVSYAVCREALAAFKCWDMRRVATRRNISGFAKHRRRAVELLISNCHANVSRQLPS